MKQVADGGVDGRAILAEKPEDFDSRLALAQVKGGKFSLSGLRDFIGVARRDKAALGCFVTLDPVRTSAARGEVAALGKVRVAGREFRAHEPLAGLRLLRRTAAGSAEHDGPLHRAPNSPVPVLIASLYFRLIQATPFVVSVLDTSTYEQIGDGTEGADSWDAGRGHVHAGGYEAQGSLDQHRLETAHGRRGHMRGLPR